MLKTRRLPGAALLLPLALASAAPAAAQDTNTVGNPQLKDFSLPGTRTTPPAPVQPAPAPVPAPTRAPAATPAPARTAPAAPRAERPRAVPAPRRETAPTGRAAPDQTAPVRTPAPQAAPALEPSLQPPAEAPPAAAPVRQAPAAQPVAPSGGFPWLWVLLGGVLVAGAAALLLFRRRRADEREVHDIAVARPAPEPAPVAGPAAAPVREPPPPAREPAIEPGRRPWLDVDFRPDRASALEDGALVHYALIVTNRGDETAGNIRIDGRMFNASADGEVDAFMKGPIHETSGSPHVTLPPGESMRLEGQIGLPKAELHAIEVQGRVIFVPLVAINLAYDWQGGTGRTSRSWLVGREASSPEARMGAFRLDLGPRIYRQVDRREAKKALA